MAQGILQEVSPSLDMPWHLHFFCYLLFHANCNAHFLPLHWFRDLAWPVLYVAYHYLQLKIFFIFPAPQLILPKKYSRLRRNIQKKELLCKQNTLFIEQVLKLSTEAKSQQQISSDGEQEKPPVNTFKLFKPKLIIFDKYGTLIDFHSTWTPWLQTLADR